MLFKRVRVPLYDHRRQPHAKHGVSRGSAREKVRMNATKPKQKGELVRFPFTVAVTVCLLSPLCQSQKAPSDFPTKVDAPPPFLPAGCIAARITNAQTLVGSKAYIFMNRDIEALELGHTASQQLQEAVTISKGDQVSFMQALTSTLTGLTDAQNNYLCASFLLGAETGGDENRRIVRRTLITVYNRMALGTWQIKTELEKSAERPTASPHDDQVKFAKNLASILDDRKDAGTDLVNAITMSAMTAVYTGDPHATKTDIADVTCGERQALLDKLHPLATASAVDEFTRAAALLEEFFQKHKCRS